MALNEKELDGHLSSFRKKLKEAPDEVYGFVINVPCEPHEIRDSLRNLEETDFQDWRFYAVRKLDNVIDPYKKAEMRLMITTDMIAMRKINEVSS